MTPTRLIDATPIADDWRLIRLPWEKTPETTTPAPGHWLWLETNEQRFCLPVRDADAGEGWIAGVLPAALLPEGLGPGSSIKRSALMGDALQPKTTESAIVVAEDIGIGAALHLAETQAERVNLVILGGQYGIPARLAPSRFYLPALAEQAIAGIGTLESLGLPARVALPEERPGVFEGDVLELLALYLSELPGERRAQTEIIALMPWGRSATAQSPGGLKAAVGSVQWHEFPCRKTG